MNWDDDINKRRDAIFRKIFGVDKPISSGSVPPKKLAISAQGLANFLIKYKADFNTYIDELRFTNVTDVTKRMALVSQAAGFTGLLTPLQENVTTLIKNKSSDVSELEPKFQSILGILRQATDPNSMFYSAQQAATLTEAKREIENFNFKEAIR